MFFNQWVQRNQRVLLSIFLFRNNFSAIILDFQLKIRKKFPLISFTRCFEQISNPVQYHFEKKKEKNFKEMIK